MKNGLPLINLIDIKIRKQGRLLMEGKNFTVDWDKLIVTVTDPDYGFYTYTMYISINLEYLNNLIKQLFSLK